MLNIILVDLEFLSNIPKDAKPNFSDKTYTFTNEWFPTFKRRYKNEKGEKGVVYMETLAEQILKIYKTLDFNSSKSLKNALQNAVIGLNNIVYTYRIDNQPEVAKSYAAFIEKFEKIINEDNKNFFNKCPSVIKYL